jgi:hypothetical protein
MIWQFNAAAMIWRSLRRAREAGGSIKPGAQAPGSRIQCGSDDLA